MAGLSGALSALAKWNPLTAGAYAAADHAGLVDKAKKAIDGEATTITPTAIPTPPNAKTDATAAAIAARKAAEAQRRALAHSQGRASTLLTGPSGLLGAAPTERKSLLGL